MSAWRPAAAAVAAAKVPFSHDRARLTSHLAANAAGDLLPATFVIKCATKVPTDQRKTTVIHTLNQQPGFTEAEGWFAGMWSRKLKDVTHYRPYLLNELDGRLVFAQNYAYMDFCGAAMWCDLVVAPALKKSGRKKWRGTVTNRILTRKLWPFLRRLALCCALCHQI